jgi:hypothetical protein
MIAECTDCGAIVNGEEVASFVDDQDESGVFGRYTFLKCPKCRRPLVMLQIDDGAGWELPQRIYPPQDSISIGSIPIPIATTYAEARTCFRAKAYTATAIMCRKTLEGLAVEHGVTGRSLVNALKEMRDKGIIESRLYEWADALRVSGNEAAHGTGAMTSAQDARDILEFTHALLEYVFTFRDKFEKWKARKEAKSNQAPF